MVYSVCIIYTVLLLLPTDLRGKYYSLWSSQFLRWMSSLNISEYSYTSELSEFKTSFPLLCLNITKKYVPNSNFSWGLTFISPPRSSWFLTQALPLAPPGIRGWHCYNVPTVIIKATAQWSPKISLKTYEALNKSDSEDTDQSLGLSVSCEYGVPMW